MNPLDGSSASAQTFSSLFEPTDDALKAEKSKPGRLFMSLQRLFTRRSSSNTESGHSINAAPLGSSVQAQEPICRIAWASDVHFDHVDEKGVMRFIEAVREQNPSALLLAGDIELGKANPVYDIGNRVIPADGVAATVARIKELLPCPVYFICGNHDFYFSSFDAVRDSAHELSNEIDGIRYIHEAEGLELTPNTVLIGHDGWADSRAGDFWNSSKTLMDFFHIEDFGVKKRAEIFTEEVKAQLMQLGDQSANYALRCLPQMLERYDNVVFLTHVPPFHEASWHEGHMADAESAPFFVNQALGEALKSVMEQHPQKRLLVLCGHTHSPSVYQPMANLTVLTAGAEYGSPGPQQAIDLD